MNGEEIGRKGVKCRQGEYKLRTCAVSVVQGVLSIGFDGVGNLFSICNY